VFTHVFQTSERTTLFADQKNFATEFLSFESGKSYFSRFHVLTPKMGEIQGLS